MFRRVIAGLFLGPALLIGSFAWSGFIALRTVFDSSRSATIAQELLDNEEVRSQLADNIGTALTAALPDGVSISRPEVAAVAQRILADPRVENLVIQAFSATHRAFLGEGDAPRTLDLSPVAAMVREQLVSAVPGLDERLPAAEPLVVTLPTDQIPNARPVRDFLTKVVPILAAISLVGVLIALLATSDRPSVLKRAAGWAIGTTAVYLTIGLAIPGLLRRFAPAQAKVIAALLTALLRSTLTPSIILAMVGGGLLVAAFAWPDRSERAPAVAAPLPPPRPVLPTRASAPDSVDLPAWTGEPAPVKRPAPNWVDGHGWVLDPDDSRPPPPNSRWVEGIGHVIPGPPPQS